MLGKLFDAFQLIGKIFREEAVADAIHFGGEGIGQVCEFAGFTLKLDVVRLIFPGWTLITRHGCSLGGGRWFGPTSALRQR